MTEYKYKGLVILLTMVLLGGAVFTVSILDDRVVVELPVSEGCDDGLTLIVHDDYMKVKCGWHVVFESKEYVDYWRTYGVNEDTGEDAWWVQDNRKASLIDVYVVDETPGYFVVRKEVPYYKGYSGTDGLLVIDYIFTSDKIKWNYNFTHENTAKHRIRLKIIKDRTDDYEYDFSPDDMLYVGMVDGEHHYGNIKGNLFIDPVIQIASEGQYQQSFWEPFDNETDIQSKTNVTISGGLASLYSNDTGYVYSTNISVGTNWSRVNLTTKTWDDGVGNNGSVKCNVSQDNSTWFDLSNVGDSKLFSTTTQYFFYQCFLDNNGTTNVSIDSLNFTFGEAIWVESVNVTPLNPFINSVLTCNYQFFTTIGADESVVNWYVNGAITSSEWTDVDATKNITTDKNELGGSGCFYVAYPAANGNDGNFATYALTDNSVCMDYRANYTLERNTSNVSLVSKGSAQKNYCWNWSESDWIYLGQNDLIDVDNISTYSVVDDCVVDNEVNTKITMLTAFDRKFYEAGLTYTTVSPSLDSSSFAQNDDVFCKVTPYDGTTYGVTLNSSNTVSINYTGALNFTVEGYNITKKFEQSTSPNISCTIYDTIDGAEVSTVEACISIDLEGYGTNYVCDNGTVNVTWEIPYVSLTKWNTSVTSINATDNGTITFDLEDYYNVLNLTFDLWNYNYTEDATLDVLNDNSVEINLRGNFSEDWLNENRFADDNVSKEFFLLTSTSVSHNLLLSTAGNFTENITLTINASESNPVELDYEETWLSDEYFNDTGSYNGALPVFVLDSLTSERSGRWNFDITGGGTASYDAIDERVESYSYSYTDWCPSSTSIEETDNSWANTKDAVIDLIGNTRVDVDLVISLSGYDQDSSSCTTDSAYYNSRAYVYISYGTSGGTYDVALATFRKAYDNCYNDGCGGTETLSLRKTSDTQWAVYWGASLLRTVTIAEDVKTYLTVKTLTYATCRKAICGGSRASSSATAALAEISYGGFGKNWSGTNFTNGNYTATSDILINSGPTDTVSISPTYYTSEADASCTATFFVSADDGANWDDVASETFHTFDTPGSIISYKIEVNDTADTTGDNCGVYGVKIEVASSSPNNTVIYFGTSSETPSYNFTGVLNETNTPMSISFSASILNDYVEEYCTGVTCTVPLLLVTDSGTGGILTVHNMSFNQTLDDVFVEGTDINTYLDGCSGTCSVNITVNRSNDGIIKFSDLNVLYYGSGNISLQCESSTENLTSDYTLQVRHSPFTVNFVLPQINSWDMYPSSVNAKNVQPFGQTSVSSIYIANFTGGEEATDLYMSLNNTIDSWFTVWTTNTSSYTTNAVVLETDVDNKICDGIAVDGSCNIWMWANLTACTSVGIPNFQWNSMCHDCVITVDSLEGD